MAMTAPSKAYLATTRHTDAFSTSHLDDIPVLEKAHSDLPLRDDDLSIPDGGHGWIVLAGCTVVCWWSIGTAQSYGIIQAALLQENVSTSTTLMFVGSMSVGIVCAFAILYAKIMRTLGTRWTAMLGILLMSLSGAISSVVYDNVGALFATYGVLMGLGMGLTFTTVAVAPTQYFLRRRGLANGIVLAGGGAGGAVVSIALNAIIHRLGIAWAFRIHCLLVACTGLPAAFVIQERVPYKPSGLVDWTLFRNKTFVLLFFAGALGIFPIFVPPYCMPTFAESIGLSSGTGAGLVAAFNAASAIGRISSGFLSDKIGSVNVALMSMSLLGTTMFLIWPFASTLGVLIVFVLIAGVAVGGFFSMMPTVVGHIFGSANMSVTMGMILTSWTFGYLLGSPIAGYILEASGGANHGIAPYRPAMYFAGSLALASATLIAIVRLRRQREILGKS
ncbi:hypothetical protein Q7P36_005745 [Cladosporium allicinum]